MHPATNQEYDITVHVPLEARSHQQQELDKLGEAVRELWNAGARVLRLHGVGVEVSVMQALRGECPPLPPGETSGTMPTLTRTQLVRALKDARSACGWTARVGTAVVEGIVRSLFAEFPAWAPGTRLPLSAFPALLPPGPAPELPMERAASFRSPETLEVLGLSDAQVPIHLHLPEAFQRAVLAQLDDEQARVAQRQDDLLRRLPFREPDTDGALAFLLGRYPAAAVARATPGSAAAGPAVTFAGVQALVRRHSQEGQVRYWARLAFRVGEVPLPAYPEAVVGVDVNVRHPLAYYSRVGVPGLITNERHRCWAYPELTRARNQVLAPFDAELSRVRWYAHLHASLQPALDAAALGPLGLLGYGFVALERLDLRPLGGPHGFSTFMTYSGLAAVLEILPQLRPTVWVDPRGTSVTCAVTEERGTRRGLLFRSPRLGWTVADLNAARRVFELGQRALHRGAA